MASIQLNVDDGATSHQKPVVTIFVEPTTGLLPAFNADGPADDVMTVSTDNASGVVDETKEEGKELLGSEKESKDVAAIQEAPEPAAPVAEEPKDPAPEPAQPVQESTEDAMKEVPEPSTEAADEATKAPVEEPKVEPAEKPDDVPSVRRASVFKEIEVETSNADGSTTVTVTEPPALGDDEQHPKRTVTTVRIESPQKDDASTLNEAAPSTSEQKTAPVATPEPIRKDKARVVDKIRASYPNFFLNMVVGHSLQPEVKQKLKEKCCSAADAVAEKSGSPA